MFTRRAAVAFLLVTPFAARATPPEARAEAVARVLDSLGVEEKWIAGTNVDWRTGAPVGDPMPLPAHHTHCSAFVAAAAERLGVYILRPPEHGQILLANAQFDWLTSPGRTQGWQPLADGAAAQAAANRGLLVVAAFKNPDPKVAGHIAIVRPTDQPLGKLASEGPELIMAGVKNWRKVTAKAGFSWHHGAFPDQIRYFAHDIPAGALG